MLVPKILKSLLKELVLFLFKLLMMELEWMKEMLY